MKRELARDIVELLNTPAHVEMICEYADYQIERAKTALSFAHDIEEVRREQGRIRGMEELKKIRDVAAGVLAKEK